ncbi:MAG: carbohydrate ABC transporter permease [Clostridiaceae bacterium]|nr:carbohydrate ABC transporter permease [Clostridiaceae bacterium]
MVERKTIGSLVFDIVLSFIMLLFFILFVYPFLYIVLYSISDISKLKFPLLIYPAGMNFDSYITILKTGGTLQAAIVSIARSVIGPFGMLLVSGMGAFAISRQDLVFGKGVRMFFLFSMYVSAGLIPGYILIKSLGLTNNFWVYIIPGLANVFNMILMKAYISSIPHELEESVKIDGGSDLDAYFRVILPLCTPVNAAVVLFAVIGQWNSYFDVSLYNGSNQSLYTLSYTLYLNLSSAKNVTLEELKLAAQLGRTVRVNSQSLSMAMTVIAMVPVMCIYPILQKYFASGLLIGSVKM